MVVAVALVVMMAVLGAAVALVKPRVSTTCWAHTAWSLPTTDDYSTGHQFSARALILGKNWVKKKAHCAVWAMLFGRG